MRSFPIFIFLAAAIILVPFSGAFAADYLCKFEQLKKNDTVFPETVAIRTQAGRKQMAVIDERRAEHNLGPKRGFVLRNDAKRAKFTWTQPVLFRHNETEEMRITLIVNQSNGKARIHGKFEYALNTFSSTGTCLVEN